MLPPARYAVVQANSPVHSPTSDTFTQPTYLYRLATGLGSTGARLSQSDTLRSGSQASIPPLISWNRNRPAIEGSRQRLGDFSASNAPFGPSIRSNVTTDTATLFRGERVLQMPRPNVSPADLQPGLLQRPGQLSDSVLAADRAGLELPHDVLRNVVWFLRGQQIRNECEVQSSLPRDAMGRWHVFRKSFLLLQSHLRV